MSKMGYDIGIFVDGSSWQIARSTENLSLGIIEKISGNGNFSRYNYIKDISGIKYNERASAVRGGNISLNESTRFISVEGPVFIKYALTSSANRDVNEEKQKLAFNESAKITINEYWPVYFLNYRSISFFGKGIRTSERYENEGEVISTYSDSWMLRKQSIYNTLGNRSDISVSINPHGVLSTRNSNTSSRYLLDLKSIGSISSIDIKRTKPSDEKEPKNHPETLSQISQDYMGGIDINLRYESGSYLSPPLNETNEDYISCCIGNDLYSQDDIFNCSCTR